MIETRKGITKNIPKAVNNFFSAETPSTDLCFNIEEVYSPDNRRRRIELRSENS
jgi:hypothetical protein